MNASLLLTLAEQEARAVSLSLRLVIGINSWRWPLDYYHGQTTSRMRDAEEAVRLESVPFASRTLDYPKDTEMLWAELCSRIAAGDVGGLDQFNVRLQGLLYTRTRNIGLAWNIVSDFTPQRGEDASNPTVLEKAIIRMIELRQQILTGWETLESLVEKLAKHPVLSAGELAGLAEKYPPPQSWYDEDFSKLA